MSEDTKKIRANYMKEYRKKNVDKLRDIDLRRTYGISLDQYNILLEAQNYVCAICGKPEIDICNKKGATRNLAVDHCHTTGRVRGLLCRGCNQGLGNFKEDISSLKKAIQYIARKT